MKHTRRRDDHQQEDEMSAKIRKIFAEEFTAANSPMKNGESWPAYFRRAWITPSTIGWVVVGVLTIWTRAQAVEDNAAKALTLGEETQRTMATVSSELASLREQFQLRTKVLESLAGEMRTVQQDVKLSTTRAEFNAAMSSLRALNREIVPRLENIERRVRALPQ